ncbi:MAG: glycosyltransferase family 4 protein [Sneathiella sp.]|nr:glycosyltransferase family 4 protein [Sneathiella sp.]
MNIAFYAPMKSPFHPVPSGDRRVARLLMSALKGAGYDPELASDLRAYDKNGESAFQEKIHKQSAHEVARLIVEYKSRPAADRPVAWFTYHVYHKAPDWLGPKVCKALNIPYLVAEASHAPKQAKGPWKKGYLAAAEAIQQANRVFHMTRLDGECLKSVVDKPQALVYLPPSIDRVSEEYTAEQADRLIANAGGRQGVFNLLSVAMMRPGDKLESYRQLSFALDFLPGEDWQLLVVGDGPERLVVEEYLASHKDRIVYMGALEMDSLFGVYRKADLYIWPAYGEAYGMAFLEAQISGLPVVGGKIRGVPDVVLDGETGLLCAPGDMREFANTIRGMLDDPERRNAMSTRAIQFVKEERSVQKATTLLAEQLKQVIR